MNNINSKERVQLAVSHRPVDRVPKGELGVDDRVISACLGIDEVQFEHRPEFAEIMGMDLWCLSIPQKLDLSPIKACLSPSDTPLYGASDWSDLSRWARETDKYPLVMVDGPFGRGIRQWGFEGFLLKVIRNDPALAELVAAVENANLHHIEKSADLGAAGIVLADDIAYQNGLIVAPEMLRNGFFPSLNRQALFAREKGLSAFFHSDGNLEQVLGDIARLGFDGLQCIEEAAGMDLSKVRSILGTGICLWGNLDPIYLTEAMDPGVLDRKVRDVVENGHGEGGFIFGSSSGLYQWVRPELVRQAYRAAETVWSAP